MVEKDHERIAELVVPAQTGDREAFSQIVRIMMNDVVALTYRMTGDRDTALDLAQDSFVTAWQKLGSFQRKARFASWMYRIVYNKTLNFLERSKRATILDRMPEQSSEQGAGGNGNPEQALYRRELARYVLQFMESLPPQQRWVFDLRFYKGLTFDEISRVTGRATGTVKTHYREAVSKLREHAQRKGWI
ncbi:MAG: RNA polymerase sigma factor [candidate division Zixibacteria bacterium]|nr:RNA polymerase sigma factor [candidate division Zixibacteria bacterium]